MSLNEWREYFRNNPNECNLWARDMRDSGYRVPQDIPDLIKNMNDYDLKIKLSAFMMECYGWKNKATSRKNNSRKTLKKKSHQTTRQTSLRTSKKKSRQTSRRTSKKKSTSRKNNSRQTSRRTSKKKSTSQKNNSRRTSKKKSRQTSRKTSKKSRRSKSRQRDNRQCEPQTGTKYLNRSSPPYPANKCCGLVKQGNDGHSYISKEDKKGVCHWKKY